MINEETTAKIRKYSSKSFYFRSYLIFKLPMGFLSGMRIKKLDEEKCVVTVSYKWLNKNPFKSTFWAVLGMAAEMNGAAVILQYTYGHKPSISTLPVKCEAEFLKKATDTTIFTCNDSKMVKEKVEEAIRTGEGVTFNTTSNGLNKNGEIVCKFNFTWSIKRRSK